MLDVRPLRPGVREIIIELGGPEGAITLYGQRDANGGWWFTREARTLFREEYGNEDAVLQCCEASVSGATTWTGALRLLDRSPWAELHPVEIHPDFRDRIWEAVIERNQRMPGEDAWRQAALSRWRLLCSSSA